MTAPTFSAFSAFFGLFLAVALLAPTASSQSVLAGSYMSFSKEEPSPNSRIPGGAVGWVIHVTLHCPNNNYIMDETTIQVSLRPDNGVEMTVEPEQLVFPQWWCFEQQNVTSDLRFHLRFSPELPHGFETVSTVALEDITNSPLHGNVPSATMEFQFTLNGTPSVSASPETANPSGRSVPLPSTAVAIAIVAGTLVRRRTD